MSDIPEAIGTIAEGGLYASAAEPGADGPEIGENGHTIETACLNCETPLIGPHCHNCGQHAHIHRTILAFLHDLLHGALHFEGKIWRTLPLLVFRPGSLTRRYIAGERARFVSPMALFLFAIFLMFGVFQAIGLTTPSEISAPPQLQQNLTQAQNEAAAGLAAKRSALEEAPIGSAEHTLAREELEDSETTLSTLQSAQSFVFQNGSDGKIPFNKTGWEWLDKGIEKWRNRPELMLYKMQSNSYKFSWLLIPLSIPFVWLLFFWRRQFKAYDHAIFVTYSLAFMSLAFVTFSVLNTFGVPGKIITLSALLIPPTHIYYQLRGAYGLTRFSAIWRLAVLLVFVCLILLLFVQLVAVMGALG